MVNKSLVRYFWSFVPAGVLLGSFFFVSVPAASAAQICAYVAADGVYACIAGSEQSSDCSSVIDCSGKDCQRIDSGKCGRRAFNYSCVAGDGKYACSPGNKADCSDARACGGKGCVKIDPANCGKLASTGGATGQEAGGQETEGFGVDLTIQRVGNIITGIACWILSVILAVMIIAVVIAGLRFFLSRGEPGAVTAARKNLLWVLAGVAVIMAVYVIIATIAGFIGADYKSFLPLRCSAPLGCVDDAQCVSRSGPGYRCVPPAEEEKDSQKRQCVKAEIRE